MKQYIERQAAIATINGAGAILSRETKEMLTNTINRIMPADVVPVVRCKDCEQYVAGEIGYGKCNFFKTAIFSEFYCRYGGKKGRA